MMADNKNFVFNYHPPPPSPKEKTFEHCQQQEQQDSKRKKTLMEAQAANKKKKLSAELVTTVPASPMEEQEQSKPMYKKASSPMEKMKKGNKRGCGYLKEEIEMMLDNIQHVLLIGPDKWKDIAELHVSNGIWAMISMVKGNADKYTKCNYHRVIEACHFQNVIMRPGNRELMNMSIQHLKDCPTTQQDIMAATDIFGPNLDPLKARQCTG